MHDIERLPIFQCDNRDLSLIDKEAYLITLFQEPHLYLKNSGSIRQNEQVRVSLKSQVKSF